jgi:hypothetical protein
MESCSVGIKLGEECHKKTFIQKSQLCVVPNEEIEVLSLRTRISQEDLSTICSHHYKEFLTYFSLNIKKCCDVLNIHKKAVRTNLMVIKMEHRPLHNNLIPGDKLCFKCFSRLKHEDDSNSISDRSEYLPDRPLLDNINSTLATFETSPIKTKLSTPQIMKSMRQKRERFKKD